MPLPHNGKMTYRDIHGAPQSGPRTNKLRLNVHYWAICRDENGSTQTISAHDKRLTLVDNPLAIIAHQTSDSFERTSLWITREYFAELTSEN